MLNRIVRVFVFSAGLLFLATALAKLISGAGSARILQSPDPILDIPFRHVLLIVGGIEMLVAMLCLFSSRAQLQAGVIALLSTNFILYRFGLWLVGWHRPCACLGNLTDALHISPSAADTGMKIVLGYCLIGSYLSLYWAYRNSRQHALLEN